MTVVKFTYNFPTANTKSILNKIQLMNFRIAKEEEKILSFKGRDFLDRFTNAM